MIDAYQSEDGVDYATSTNEVWDSTSKSYSPSGGNTNMTLISNIQKAVTASPGPSFGRLMIY